jgi:hypothetical protein
MVNQEVRANRPPHRTVEIRAGQQILNAEDPLPDELRDALALIT